ncbi:MAG: DHHA1 domain-containing protein, partial [Planktomarina sp.]
ANEIVVQSAPVSTKLMGVDDAIEAGAMALFGEKYGDEVRVVSMGRQTASGKGVNGDTYSLELCGGVHVDQTGDIGTFVLLGDSASSSGVRRIEALTGAAAVDHLLSQSQALGDAAQTLKVQNSEVGDRAKALLEERKALQAEVANLRRELAMSGGAADGPAVETVGGKSFVAQVLSGVTGKDLPALVDAHKGNIGSGVVLLIAEADGKAAVAAGVSDDHKGDLSAVDIVKLAVTELGGKGGGGRPDMAQGGAKSAENADAAIAAVKKLLEG